HEYALRVDFSELYGPLAPGNNRVSLSVPGYGRSNEVSYDILKPGEQRWGDREAEEDAFWHGRTHQPGSAGRAPYWSLALLALVAALLVRPMIRLVGARQF